MPRFKIKHKKAVLIILALIIILLLIWGSISPALKDIISDDPNYQWPWEEWPWWPDWEWPWENITHKEADLRDTHSDRFTPSISTTFNDFPVRLHITSAFYDFWENTNNQAEHFVFKDKNNNTLNAEIEWFDYVNHDAVFYVNAPVFDNSHPVYLISGKGTGSLGDSNLVWDNHYTLVCHMDDHQDDMHIRDVKNGFIGTKHSPTYGDQPVCVDGAQHFDGLDDYISFGNNIKFSPLDPTVEIVFNFDSTTSNMNQFIIRKHGYATYVAEYELWIRNQYQILWANVFMQNKRFPLTDGTVYANTWYHVALKRASSTQFGLYLNGERKANGDIPYGGQIEWSDADLILGCCYVDEYQQLDHFKGYITEFRISDISRTDGWVGATARGYLETLGTWYHSIP